jgi:acyl-CoA thioester hydrolase
MASEFRIQRYVEFSETDMAGIVHFSNFFRYMEAAETAFFRSLGFSVMLHRYDPPIGFPRVHVECDYMSPLLFEDMVEVRLLVREKKSRRLGFLFRIRKMNASPPIEVACGKVTVVCVEHPPGGPMRAVPIPAEIADKIEVAAQDSLASGQP